MSVNPQIGSLTFRSMTGAIAPMAETSIDITPLGVEPNVMLLQGKKGDPTELTTIYDASSKNAAVQHVQDAANRQGQVLTIRLAINTEYDNMFIVSSRPQPIRRVINCVGGLNIDSGDNGYLVTIQWTVRQIEE